MSERTRPQNNLKYPSPIAKQVAKPLISGDSLKWAMNCFEWNGFLTPATV
jgi:hypothetical protein